MTWTIMHPDLGGPLEVVTKSAYDHLAKENQALRHEMQMQTSAVRERYRLQLANDKMTKALQEILNQPFRGSWDAQACFVQNILAEVGALPSEWSTHISTSESEKSTHMVTALRRIANGPDQGEHDSIESLRALAASALETVIPNKTLISLNEDKSPKEDTYECQALLEIMANELKAWVKYGNTNGRDRYSAWIGPSEEILNKWELWKNKK